MTYEDFIRAKQVAAPDRGAQIEVGELKHPFFHVRAISEWAIRGGRRAVFSAFGTQKTLRRKGNYIHDSLGEQMKPYYEESGITIYHGNSLQIMPTLDSFDWSQPILPIWIWWEAISER